MQGLLFSQIEINIFLQNLSAILIQIMKWVTFLGEEYFYLIFMPLLYWCIDSRVGFRVGAMMILSNGVVNSLKMVLQSPRPYWLDRRVFAYAQETSFGMPSGHATNAASFWGVLANSIKKSWMTIILILVILLIGISRLVLGVHFLTDVIAGWLLGGLLLLIFLRIEKPLIRWFNPLVFRHKIFVAIFSSILLLLPTLTISWLMTSSDLPATWIENAGHLLEPFNPEGTYTIAGTWAGILIGASWFKHRYGQFSTKGKFMLRFWRYFLGFIGIIVLWFGLDQIFPEGADTIGLLFRYLRYAAVGFWISGGAPLVFIKLKLSQQISSDSVP